MFFDIFRDFQVIDEGLMVVSSVVRVEEDDIEQ